VIIFLGIFLRIYRFKDWLYFYPDQARDVSLVDAVLSGKSTWPLLGPIAASTHFKLGPIYYYFQIISAKLFGSTPWAVAYPDLLFSILSIPLLYYFFKKYFSINLSLALTGLYSISFYAIRYSRFAWNSNSIPFFCLLFLLALYEFICHKDKTHWRWIILGGIALGVGIQLHTVLLVLMPIFFILIFLLLIKSSYNKLNFWSKTIAIVLIALALNTGQIISEMKTNFFNTRQFLRVFSDRSPNAGSAFEKNIALDAICSGQANILFLSSLENNDSCDSFSYFKYSGNPQNYAISIIAIFTGIALFFSGCFLLIHYFFQETDKKRKTFLGLNFLWGSLIFLVILPIVNHNGQVRYFLPILFLPFLFLGLVLNFISKNNSEKKWLKKIIFILLIGLNGLTIFLQAKLYYTKSSSTAIYITLDELGTISDYIKTQVGDSKEIYLVGGEKYLQNYIKTLSYTMSKRNIEVLRGGRSFQKIANSTVPVFFIGQSLGNKEVSEYDSVPGDYNLEIESYRSFGQIGIYKLKN
jgi:4-amino-4-deoxy-L-arabinose transferase-like glycosyltransferase